MIEIQNLTTSRIDQHFVRKVIKAVLASEGVDDKIVIEVAFVGSERIKKLNKKYRHKNRATDVLSFGGEGKYLGEIVVCVSEIKKQAKRNSAAYPKELAHVLTHGTLHLLGYEHENDPRDLENMHAKEEDIMTLILNRKS
jgi:probable rRNA maturation factor